MAVTNTRINTRIAATDLDGKSLFSYSKINPEATADEAVMFVEAVNSFRNTAANEIYLYTEDQLEDDGADE
jgi:hypothetical protein